MNPISIPVIVMSGILLFAGVLYLQIYLRSLGHREYLAFACTSLAVCSYNFCGYLFYNADTLDEAIRWQRWQTFCLALVAVGFMWFVHYFTRRGRQELFFSLGVFFLAAGLLVLLARGNWGWPADRAELAALRLGGWLEGEYFRIQPGIMPLILSFAWVLTFVYLFVLMLACYRSDRRRHMRAILIGMLAFFAGVANDISVATGLYQSIYLLEYGYTALILGMVYALTADYLDTRDALAAREARLESIFTAACDVALIMSRPVQDDLKISEFSPGAERIFGFTRREAIGLSVATLGLGAVPSAPRAAAGGLHEPGETTLKRRQGTPFPALHSRRLVRGLGPAAAIEAVVDVVVDITNRKEAVEAMRRSEERLKVVMNATRDGVWDLDFARQQGYFSEPLFAMLGYSPGDLAARDRSFWDALLHPEDRGRFAAAFERELRDGGGLEQKVRLRGNDGEYRWVLVRGKVVSRAADGSAQRMAGTHVDLTERQRLEEEQHQFEIQVQQSQKLESIGVLAGTIAHDYNDALMAVLGNADMALAELSAAGPARDAVNRIKETAGRAAGLTRQLLAYSRRGQLYLEPLNLNELVGEMTHLLRASYAKKIRLDYELAAELPPVTGDASQIGQVLMNLVTNAAEAMGEHEGRVMLRSGVARFTTPHRPEGPLDEPLPPGVYVYLEVEDNGPGLDARTLGRIFDPFFSVKSPGRGLGLPVVLSIVQAHYGTIEVAGRPGRGCRFRVYFPAGAETAEPRPVTPPAAPANPGKTGGTILIADDDEPVRLVLDRMLTRFGYTVLVAADGRECVERFRQNPDAVDLVLLDMTMPIMNGDEACREIHRIRPDVPILLASGYPEAEATGHFAGENLAGFIQKPFDMETLKKRVAAILG